MEELEKVTVIFAADGKLVGIHSCRLFINLFLYLFVCMIMLTLFSIMFSDL